VQGAWPPSPGPCPPPAPSLRTPGSKLFVLQQRAPAIPGRQRALAEEVAAWLAAAGAAQALVLSGLDAQYRRESQLEGSQARYLPAAAFAAAAAAPAPPHISSPRGGGGSGGGGGNADVAVAAAAAEVSARLAGLALSGAEASGAAAAEALGVARLEADALARELELHSLLPPWLVLAAAAAAGLPATALGRFAAEGDNVADGLALAKLALNLLARLGVLPAGGGGGGAGAPEAAALKTPGSWVGLYGRPYEEVA
jgi:proteasome assembly chaperone 2